ncbi:MAG: N-acetylmuramoyl-L-alanine amidase [Faecousia sp.]
MRLLQCLLYRNRCYLKGETITPTKIVLHSTGCNNPWLERYVQPHSGQTTGMECYQPVRETYTRDQMLAILGTNRYENDWNRDNIDACVNAFIGKLDDGSLAVVQTLPWTMRPWGVGSGSNGSYNDCAIQFEICEDNHASATYCKETFEVAAQLCAHLMRSYPTITEIVSHNEAHRRGYGSGHNDPDNWWPKHGLTMDKFRARVKELLAPEPHEKPVPEQMYRIRKSWDDAKSQVGAYRSLYYARNACPAGYTVFDQDGNAVYSPEEQPKTEKPDPARSRNDALAGTYTVRANGGLHLRAGAGTDKTSLEIMPNGSKVKCYGYYTGNWLLVVSASGRTGFAHKDYLVR